MAVFPKTEAEIKALAQAMITGMTDNPDFPAPPVSPADLQTLLNAFISEGDAQIAAYAAAEQITVRKQAALEALIAAMRANLHYAEYIVAGDDAKLNFIGWSGRTRPAPIAAPGQPVNLRVTGQAPGTVRLTWERPNEGGTAAYFVIKRHGRGEGEEWVPVHTLIGIEVELSSQERGKELEYCLVAVNKAGESLPSNSVTVVL